MEGSIAFIWELILLRKPKLKHLSASQIKRFSAKIAADMEAKSDVRILELDQSSQFARERAREWPLYSFNSYSFSDGGGRWGEGMGGHDVEGSAIEHWGQQGSNGGIGI